MEATEVADTCKYAAAKIEKGEETGILGGLQSLLNNAANAIEEQIDHYQRMEMRATKLNEALQMSKREVEELRVKVGVLAETNERYGRVIDHLLDE